jgi:Kdo2-lipid IVA lauroyltransferase/acyltransferase
MTQPSVPMKIFHFLIYALLKPWLWIVGKLGFRFSMTLGKLVGWWLFYVVRYRRKVVVANLRACFSGFSQLDTDHISRLYYRYLGRIIGETIALPGMSKRHMLFRCIFEENDLLMEYYHKNQSVIMVMGHYGNWEWAGLGAAAREAHEIVAIYKTQKNPYIDRYLRRIRGRFGTRLVPMEQAPRAVLQEKNLRPKCFTFIADQSANPSTGFWVHFLNRDTLFHSGWAKLACKSNLPVLFARVNRKKNARYKVSFELLHSHPEDTTPELLVQAYAHKLENQIQGELESWLWSHRRWKHQRG